MGRGDNSAYDIELAFLQRSIAAPFQKYQLPCLCLTPLMFFYHDQNDENTGKASL